MVMKLILILLIVGLVGIGSVSGYFCLQQEDNINVLQFKDRINRMAIDADLERGINPEAIETKIKLFHPCKEW